MIRVDFLYKVKTSDLPQMMKKFEESIQAEFQSTPSNVKIEMAFYKENETTLISLNIYYNSEKDYELRTKFERSQQGWLNIWFKENDIFELVSQNVFFVQ
ncbi:hypothetical protein X560_0892 [Listeria fleischmannii 1991]|uniref:ABM domain-containing protein n=2 Tax=Listeria fleischmannii TaxID=1069827 RepID=A0A2X3HGS5_9LIST|nr:hypothetical protein [Listeria fleischmannii]EMG27156.1 hypothetical protein LFLEISCH_12665 [Listeria fleischmannii subsp. fleischmannii LU2006-1]KMT60280.1 hypothetical protein X560_0892 [Listeria fleischmannii 1991]SQC70384.1 Uncharacterised protein [Listeria fleischmannii subsp. fleischmannii]